MIKVNQITNTAQAQRLAGKVDVGGICLTRSAMATPPYISEQAARTLASSISSFPLAIAFNPADAYSLDEIQHWLTELQATYFEYTPVDFAKQLQFDEQLRLLEPIKLPRIASGFFLQRDDCSFIQDPVPFDRLRDSGVALAQFEINSAVSSGFKLRKQDLALAETFFKRFPCLVSDAFTDLPSYPLKHLHGFFFNISAGREAGNYDYSVQSYPESTILRLLLKR